MQSPSAPDRSASPPFQRLLYPAVLLLLAAGSPLSLSAAVTALPAKYAGTAVGYANFDLASQIRLADSRGNTNILGVASVKATLNTGTLVVDRIDATVASTTWSGSGIFVNPLFQTVGVSLVIVTNPTTFTISSTQVLALTTNSNGPGLMWSSGLEFPGTISNFVLSGSYILQGPTQTVTGTFSHTIASRGLNSEGLLRVPNYPDEIELSGTFAAFFPGTFSNMNLLLVNGTVDGVSISAWAEGGRSNMGVNFGNPYNDEFTSLQSVPEPSCALLFTLLGSGIALRRSRGLSARAR